MGDGGGGGAAGSGEGWACLSSLLATSPGSGGGGASRFGREKMVCDCLL